MAPDSPSPETETGIVLLIDDDESVLTTLRRWIEPLGREVATCRSFHEARDYLSSNTPAVLVVDVRLQGYNGLQFVVWAKDKRPEILCVVLTGFDDPVLRAETERLGARFLVKPVVRADFLAALGSRKFV